MKKLLALVLALALTFSLVACGKKDDSSSQAPVSGGDAAKEPLRVHLIVSNLGDKSFNDSAYNGLKKAETDLGIKLSYVEFGTDNSKAEPTMLEAAEEGYDVVIFNNLGFGMAAEWLTNNAATYPDTTFLMYDEVSYEPTSPNVQCLVYKANESDFLAGALAAKMSKSGVISFVGGMDNPVIADFLVGYIQGAQYANPDVKMTIAYTENWTDAPKGKELGLAAINSGADVIHAVAGGAGNGALEAAQSKGALGIGVDSDQYELFKAEKPELAASIVTSSLKNVGESLYATIKTIQDGTFVGGGKTWFGMPEGCAGIAENENYLKLVDAETQKFIEDTKAKMISGEIKVDSYYGMAEDAFKALKAGVEKK